MDGGLGKLFQDHLPLWHWQRIETGGTGKGIPDLNGCRNGVDVWIENKLVECGEKIDISPEQVGWISRRTRAGGRAFIAVRYLIPAGPRRGPAVDALRLFPGHVVKALATAPKGVAPLVIGAGGPAHWPWGEVERVLFSFFG